MLTGDDARFVPLLSLTEGSFAESGLSTDEAAQLVTYALGNGSSWWAERALDWVGQGVPAAAVMGALNHATEDDRLPQAVRHRALRVRNAAN